MSFASDFGSLFLSTCVIATIVVLIYLHHKKRHSYWKSQGVNGPTPLPLVGTVYQFLQYDWATLAMENIKKYGNIYGYYEGSRLSISVSEPELLKQVFIKDVHIYANRRDLGGMDEMVDNMLSAVNGKQWKNLRSIVSPTFSSGKIKRMKPLIEKCARDATDFLEEVAEKKEEFQVKKFWDKFTLQVIACCCFATSINAHKDPNNVFLQKITQFIKPRPLFMLLFLILPFSILKRLPIKMFPTDSMEFVKEVVLHLVKKRREEGTSHNDFLQLLIEAEKENKDKDIEPLTEIELVSQCVIFFAAGYETTANLLRWSSYALAMNPEIQENLYNEIRSHFKSTEEIDYETVNKLPYLDAFMCETFRMFPPVVNTERVTTAEVELGDTGIKVPTNTIVNVPIYAIHHDSANYSEPEKFNPERFMNENKDGLNPYTYLPFGLGPRNCVAMRFAIVEAKLVLIHTIFKFKLLKSKNTLSNVKFQKMINFLIPATELFLNIEKR